MCQILYTRSRTIRRGIHSVEFSSLFESSCYVFFCLFFSYLFALQIKRDLASGILLCSDNTAALLASYIVQAEIGDYLETYNNNPSYLNNKKYFPHQTYEHEIRIMNFHKNHL